MDQMIEIITWVGGISGSVLLLLLLSSFVLGADFDFELETDTDVDGGGDGDGSGGLGVLKSLLTFLSVGSMTLRVLVLNAQWSWTLALISSIAAGVLAVLILGWFLHFLIGQEEDGSWRLHDAIGKIGIVSIPILGKKSGKITVEINGNSREIEAKSENEETLETNTKVLVFEAEEDYLIVQKA